MNVAVDSSPTVALDRDGVRCRRPTAPRRCTGRRRGRRTGSPRSSGALDEQPASKHGRQRDGGQGGERANAHREPQDEREGECSIFSHISSDPAEKPPCPTTEWIREYPQRVTSEEPPEPRRSRLPQRCLPSGRWVRRTASVASSVAPLARHDLSAARRGQGERPEDRAGHLREQPPLVHRLHRDPGGRTASGAFPREVELLRRIGLLGLVLSPVLHRDRRRAGAARSRPGRARRARPAAAAPRRGQRGGPVPRGHPVARRPALQGPHRCGVPGPADAARPVVPVGLIGTDTVMPVGARFPSLRQRVTVKFGEPLDLSHHGPAESGKARRLATDDIMAAIHALSGQELANTYNEAPAHNPIERIRQVLPHERRVESSRARSRPRSSARAAPGSSPSSR